MVGRAGRLLLDLAPGTGDMAISVAQALPNAELVVVTTPQPSASDIAVRSGLVALQVPMKSFAARGEHELLRAQKARSYVSSAKVAAHAYPNS